MQNKLSALRFTASWISARYQLEPSARTLNPPESTQAIQDVRADAIVTVCPFCHTHFDLNQVRIEEDHSEKYQIPVLHYTTFRPRPRLHP